jgi:hypothetical protein
MHQLGRPGRRPAGQVVHFTEKNRIAPARRIARDTAAIDAATDDSEVENPIQWRFPGVRLFALAISLSFWIKSQPNVKATEKGAKAPGTGTHHPAGGNSEGFSRAATQPITWSVDDQRTCGLRLLRWCNGFGFTDCLRRGHGAGF